MWFGFAFAAYSVVGNDVIQTLGTFLTSNEKSRKWYELWALLTRIGIPVSTTFLILTFFSVKSLQGMVTKSVMGYLIAFGVGAIVYTLITKATEKRFLAHPLGGADHGIWTNRKFWVGAQWFSTGFLWTQWLT